VERRRRCALSSGDLRDGMTAASTWKEMCRLLEDKHLRKPFLLESPLETYALFEIDVEQAAEAFKCELAPINEGDLAIPHFPFPRLAFVQDGLVVCMSQPYMDLDEEQFDFSVLVYEHDWKAVPTDAKTSYRVMVLGDVTVDGNTGSVTDYKMRAAYNFADASPILYVDGEPRHPWGRRAPVAAETDDNSRRKINEMSEEEIERKIEQNNRELERLEDELDKAESQLGDQLEQRLVSVFEYGMRLVYWSVHPDRFTVERSPASGRKPKKKGKTLRLPERTTMIVMTRTQIENAWRDANRGVGVHASPIPHLRRGHFRELKSERFGVNRGKRVWVRPTHVVGKCVEWRQGDKFYKVI